MGYPNYQRCSNYVTLPYVLNTNAHCMPKTEMSVLKNINFSYIHCIYNIIVYRCKMYITTEF